MNEELQQALQELIARSMELGGDALAFTQEQLPEVIQQLLVWKAAISFLGFVACLSLIIASLVFLVKRMSWRMPEPVVGPEDGEMEFRSRLTALTEEHSFEIHYHAKKLIEGLGLRPAFKDKHTPPDHLWFVAAVLGICGIGPIFNCFGWLQIWLAPKVYLIEYAASLAK